MRFRRSLLAVRLLVALLLLFVFLGTCYNAVEKLMEGRITKTTTTSFDSVRWPSVSVCNSVQVPNQTIIHGSFQDIVRRIPEKEHLISPSGGFYRQPGPTQALNGAQWSKHVAFDAWSYPGFLYFVVCFTAKIGSDIKPMDEFYAILNVNNTAHNFTNSSEIWFDPQGYSMILHEDDQLIHSILDLGGIAKVEPDFNALRRDRGIGFQFKLSINTMLSTPAYTCDQFNMQSLGDCVEDYLTRFIGCRMPWLKGNGSFKPCDKTEEFLKYTVQATILGVRNMAQLLNITGCRRNCRQYSFVTSVATEIGGGPAMAMLNAQDGVEVTEEVYLYGTEDFVADVGGYLGLLVGASVMTLVDCVLAAAQFACKRMGKEKSVVGGDKNKAKNTKTQF